MLLDSLAVILQAPARLIGCQISDWLSAGHWAVSASVDRPVPPPASYVGDGRPPFAAAAAAAAAAVGEEEREHGVMDLQCHPSHRHAAAPFEPLSVCVTL